jgi:hypothetical protein
MNGMIFGAKKKKELLNIKCGFSHKTNYNTQVKKFGKIITLKLKTFYGPTRFGAVHTPSSGTTLKICM